MVNLRQGVVVFFGSLIFYFMGNLFHSLLNLRHRVPDSDKVRCRMRCALEIEPDDWTIEY